MSFLGDSPGCLLQVSFNGQRFWIENGSHTQVKSARPDGILVHFSIPLVLGCRLYTQAVLWLRTCEVPMVSTAPFQEEQPELNDFFLIQHFLNANF